MHSEGSNFVPLFIIGLLLMICSNLEQRQNDNYASQQVHNNLPALRCYKKITFSHIIICWDLGSIPVSVQISLCVKL